MPHANFIFSTCGTALLSNQIGGPDERKRLNQCSNAKSPDHILQADKDWLSGLLDRMRLELHATDVKTVARMSAELNGVIKFYGGAISRNHDYHLLLCTDTWLGEQVAEIEAEWLRKYCSTVEVRRQRDLQTAELDPFQLALSDLVKWSQETLPGYRTNGYHIVFNLTGGFKSVQGFLQTLAMFYADEVIYVFQEADALMRIPRLPVQITVDDTARRHLDVFRKLRLNSPVESIEDIPETMLMRIDSQIGLSPWGELVWEQTRKRLYSEKLWPTPSSRIRYGEKFEESLRELPPNRLRMINEKVDDVARYLDTGQDQRSLDLKRLKNDPCPPSTHELDAWADQDAKRIYGHYEGQTFVLEKLDKALH